MRFVIISILALGLITACDKSNPAAPAKTGDPAATASSSTTAAHGLTRVTDASQVCMVTNQYMGVAQIPIEVEGKTYFGCCEMCKGRLANEPETRQAKDPTSGETVDKATAVIARQPDGKLLYFASADTLARYRTP